VFVPCFRVVNYIAPTAWSISMLMNPLIFFWIYGTRLAIVIVRRNRK